MSKLSQLMSEPETVEINGVEIKVYPFSADDYVSMGIVDFEQMDKPSTQTIAKMVRVTLKRSFPDATEDELKSFPLIHFTKLSEAIQKANKVNLSEAEERLLEKLDKAKLNAAGNT